MLIDPRQIEVLDDDVADILRMKSPAERLAIAHAMWRQARQMISAVVSSEHPEWDEAQRQREVAKRLSHGAVHSPTDHNASLLEAIDKEAKKPEP